MQFKGIPELPRKSFFHALNQKVVAKRYAKESSKNYEDINVIVAHMGGSVSVRAHKKGKMVDLIKEKVEFIGSIIVYPGEGEMLALAQGAIRVLSGEEEVKEYQ